jgi:hypothetical protein
MVTHELLAFSERGIARGRRHLNCGRIGEFILKSFLFIPQRLFENDFFGRARIDSGV